MKILIAYDSGNGTVKTAVEYLMRGLTNLDVTVVSLAEATPDPSGFDMVIAGGSVRFGKLRAAVRSFLSDNESILARKKLGLFFCCGLTEEQEYYAEKLFSDTLRENAFHVAFFGGSLNTEGLGFLDRLLVKSIRSSLFEKEMDDGNYVPNLPYILPENMDAMIHAIQAEATQMTPQK